MMKYKKSTVLDPNFQLAKLQVNLGYYDQAVDICRGLIVDIEALKKTE